MPNSLESEGVAPGPGSRVPAGTHGPMDPWTHGPMDPWAHGSMGPWSIVPSTKNQVPTTKYPL